MIRSILIKNLPWLNKPKNNTNKKFLFLLDNTKIFLKVNSSQFIPILQIKIFLIFLIKLNMFLLSKKIMINFWKEIVIKSKNYTCVSEIIWVREIKRAWVNLLWTKNQETKSLFLRIKIRKINIVYHMRANFKEECLKIFEEE